MDGKHLGKIESVKFGHYETKFGIVFRIGGQGWGTTDFWGHASPAIVKHESYMRWTEEDRSAALVDMCVRLSKLLEEAKKTDISELKGTPIEVTLEGNLLRSWRVLTEVL